MISRKSIARGTAIALGVATLTMGLGVPSASADEVYIGTAKGAIDVHGFPDKHQFTDAQYRSTSLPNLRKHTIRVSFKGCLTEWRARASVKWGSRIDTVEQTVSGCNKSVYLTPAGDMNASVQLTIKTEPGGFSASKSIAPIRR